MYANGKKNRSPSGDSYNFPSCEIWPVGRANGYLLDKDEILVSCAPTTPESEDDPISTLPCPYRRREGRA